MTRNGANRTGLTPSVSMDNGHDVSASADNGHDAPAEESGDDAALAFHDQLQARRRRFEVPAWARSSTDLDDRPFIGVMARSLTEYRS